MRGKTRSVFAPAKALTKTASNTTKFTDRFSSVRSPGFAEKFDVKNDPDEIIIDFKDSRVADHSAIEALHKITERYAKVEKQFICRHLSEDCRKLLDDASAIIDVNHWEDPNYKLVSDTLG